MIIEYVNHLKATLHGGLLGGHAWLEWFAFRVIDFVTSPFTGVQTRSYWPEIVAGMVIAAIAFIARDRLAGQGLRAFLRYYFPASMWRHRSTWVDWQIIVMNQFFASAFNITWRFNGALATGALLGGLIWTFGPSPHLLHWGTPALVLFTILLALADDFGYYIFHLSAHRIRWLWAFHKVHHSAETLTLLANVRIHPLEYAVIMPCKAATTALVLAPALYLGTGEATTVQILGMNLMAAFFCVTGTQLHHSHIWISWGRVLEHVFISPAQHQIHHSTAPRHWNRNMGGNFALWDWMFGTLYIPDGREQLTFGLLGEGQPYRNALAAYVLPFWEILPGRERIQLLATRWLQRPLVAAVTAPAPETNQGVEARP